MTVPILVLGAILATPANVATLTLGIVFVALIGYFIGDDTADAITNLIESARQLQAGNYDVDVSTDRVDDIGRLYESFEHMASAVENREQSLQEERHQLAALFENSSDCIARVELDDLVIQDLNRRFEERFGYDSAAIAGESLADLVVGGEDLIDTDDLRQRVQQGDRIERELCIETDGGTREFRFRFVPVSTNHKDSAEQIEGYVVCTDITERKRAQRMLETSNQALRDLHEIITDRPGDFEETIQELLELGCEQFGLDVGILSHVDSERYEVVQAVDPSETIVPGDVFELQDTVCDLTVRSDTADVVTLPDLEAALPTKLRTSLQDGELEAYIGTSVVVDGDVYGTVSFRSRFASVDGFAKSQHEIIKVIAQWIGAELGRQQRREELERNRELLQRTQRLANVGGWKRDLRAEESAEEIYWTDEIYRIGELPLGEELDLERAIGMFEDEQPIRAAVSGAIEQGTPYDIETRITTATGNERWVHVIGEPIMEDGNVVTIYGVVQDITERKQRERERQKTLHQLNALIENTSDAIYFKDTDGKYQLMNEAAAELVGLDPQSAVGNRDEDLFEARDAADIRRVDEFIIRTGEPVNKETELLIDGEKQVFLDNKFPYRGAGDDIVGIMGISRNITERKHYELALESLHDATRELLHTESEEAVCEVVVDIATETIDVPSVGIYLLDSENSQFTPTALTPAFSELISETPPLSVGVDTPAWKAFVSGETVITDDTTTITSTLHDQMLEDRFVTRMETARDSPDDDIRTGLFIPVGDHGVVTILSPKEVIDSPTRQLVETLVATMEAAFDRLDSESSLRERDRQLMEQNRQFRRQIQITDIIRTVDQSLLGRTSREDIETAVCERLVESDVIQFAWIGDYDATDEAVRPRSWAGDGHRYLDSVSLTSDDNEPAWLTAETGSETVIGSVVDRLQSEDWRKVALGCDFRSVISVPIVHDEYTYGMVTAYASELNDFGDLERAVFVELGETIGNAINAVQTKQAIYSDTATRLELRFTGTESLLTTIAENAPCRVEFEGLSTGTRGTTMLFINVTDTDTDRIVSILEQLVSVTDYKVISKTEDGGHFEVTVSEHLLPSTLLSHGVSLRSMVAENDRLDVVIDVPQKIDVREFVELLQSRYTSVELVARRDVERSIETKATLVEALLGALTDRQRETLLTAYYGGYFKWPRETTGEEVGTILGVSQPTVSHHLRGAEQTLLNQLFDTKYRPMMATS
ncbi:bacterio-opsin activator domain-containing protein [Haladaptatus sp. NG-SE-30]